MSDISVEELGKILEQDSQWMLENYNKLIEKYPGQRVAISDGQVVAVGNQEIRAYCADEYEAGLLGPLLLSVPHPDDLVPFITLRNRDLIYDYYQVSISEF